jgi:uncharacterized membrane protein YeiH
MSNQEIISLAGTFVFGVSGTLVASKRKLDLFGVAFVAAVSSLGGGTVRDILIGHYPLSWVQDYRLIVAVILAVICTLLVYRHLQKISKTIFVIDSIGIGLFTIVGTQYCIDLGLSTFISVVFGVLSVILGGLMRDVLCNEIPMILREEYNASVAAIGAAVYVLFYHLHFTGWLPTLICISLIAAMRILSKRVNIDLSVRV